MNPSIDNDKAFQDLMNNNNCFGCGPNNEKGLKIKSYWYDDDTTICKFKASNHHCAAPTHFLNGGITSTLMDCHAIGSAIALCYKNEHRMIGTGEDIFCVTGSLSVNYLRPVSIDSEITIRAEFGIVHEKKIAVKCKLYTDETLCSEADVIAIRVPADWNQKS